jgi:hypothetical protein
MTVPIKLLVYPTVLSSGLNVWKISCWGWKAGSPSRGGRECLFLGIGRRIEVGRERCPRGYDSGAVESKEDRRSVRENEPWVSSSAAGALAVFYLSAYFSNTRKRRTIVKLAFPFSLIVTGSVTSSSPFKSSNKR